MHNGRLALKIPAPPEVAGGFVGINARRADVDQVAGKGALQHSRGAAAEIDPAADAHHAQIPVSGEFLVVPRAAIALDAAVHFVLDQRSQVLVVVGALEAPVAAQAMATGNGQVLQQAVSAFVAHRAVVGMVEHEPFDDVPPEIHGFGIRGGNHHAVLGVDHAAHLDALDRSLRKGHGTDPAGPHRSQGRVIAEARDHDAQPFGRLDHLGAGGDFDLPIVDLEFGHDSLLGGFVKSPISALRFIPRHCSVRSVRLIPRDSQALISAFLQNLLNGCLAFDVLS